MRRLVGVLAVLFLARVSLHEARAEEIPDSVGDDGSAPEPSRPFLPTLARPPGFGAALEGHAGIALLVGPGATRSRAVLGGLLRFRYRYLQLAGVAEISDS